MYLVKESLGATTNWISIGLLGPFALANCKNRCHVNHMFNRARREECIAGCEERREERRGGGGSSSDSDTPITPTGTSPLALILPIAGIGVALYVGYRLLKKSGS